MIARILVPLDGSALADAALVEVRRLLTCHAAHVTLLHVGDAALFPWQSRPDPGAAEAARRHLDRLAVGLRAAGGTVTVVVRIGDAEAEILAAIAAGSASLVVMATHGRSGLLRCVMGSVAERVLHESPVPLLLLTPEAATRPPAERRFARILVPLDGSPRSAEILPLVTELAGCFASEVILLHVGTSVPLGGVAGRTIAVPPPTTSELEAQVLGARVACEAAGVRTRVLTAVDLPAGRILDTIRDERVDLLAMTTHGRARFARWVYGSVAEKVLRHATCPMLVLRTAARPGGVTAGR